MGILKKSIKILLLSATALCVTIFFAYSFISSARSLDKLSNIFINNIISNASERCDTWLTGKINLAKSLAGYIDIQNTSEIFKYQDYFLNAVKSYKFIDITVGFEDGTLTAGMPEGLPEGYDHRKRNWYINAMAKNAPYISEPYIDATTGFPCITVCVPIKINNKTVGIFSFDLDFSELDAILLNSESTLTDGTGMLVTSNGEIIIHERKDFTLKKVSELAPEYANVIKFITNPVNKDKQFTLKSADGKKSILFKKLNYNNWYILYEMPQLVTSETESRTIVFTIILALLAAAAIITISIFAYKKSY